MPKILVCALFAVLLVQEVAFSQAESVSLLRQGNDAMASGDYLRAVELFNLAIRKNPAYLDAHIQAARVFFILGEYDQAKTLADRAASLDRNSRDAGVLLARIQIVLGDVSGAQNRLTALSAKWPNDQTVLLATSELYVASGRLREAGKLLEGVVSSDPGNYRALLSLGLLYQDQQNAVMAEKVFRLALQNHPERLAVQFHAGAFYRSIGKLDLALEHATIAHEIAPGDAGVRLLLGRIELDRGNYAEALAHASAAIETVHDTPEAWFLKAAAEQAQGKPADAIRSLRSILSWHPQDEIPRIVLEDILRSSTPAEDGGRLEYSTYHVDLAALQRSRNYYSRALQEYRRAAQLFPFNQVALFEYAMMQSKLGFPASALRWLQVLAKRGTVERKVKDQIELLQVKLQDSLAFKLGLDQFDLASQREQTSVGIYYRPSRDDGRYPGTAAPLARYFGDALLSRETITLRKGYAPASSGEVMVQEADYQKAFQESRQRGHDYFVLLSFAQTDREFFAEAELCLARTGARMGSYQVYRTGNDRVFLGMQTLAETIASALPVRGTLIKRTFDRAVVDLGQREGVKAGDTFVIVRRAGLQLKHDGYGFSWAPDQELGTLTVTAVDELVCEGQVTRRGFFDSISLRDHVVTGKPTENPASPAVPGIRTPLYQKIIRIP